MSSLALSTCWNSDRHIDGEAMLEEIRALGFEAAELGHGIRLSLWPGVLRAVEQQVIRISSLHNFCPLPVGATHADPNYYRFTDPRPSQRRKAVEQTLQTIRNAAQVGARAVVMHVGLGGPEGISRKLTQLWKQGKYMEGAYPGLKLEAVRERQKNFHETWKRAGEGLRALESEARALRVRLGIELRERFEEFPNAEEMQTVLNELPADVFGYWHDFGHGARQEFLGWHTHAETLARYSHRLIGCHLHDALPPDRDHLAVGSGVVGWKTLALLVPSAAIQVIEPAPDVSASALRESVARWKALN